MIQIIGWMLILYKNIYLKGKGIAAYNYAFCGMPIGERFQWVQALNPSGSRKEIFECKSVY